MPGWGSWGGEGVMPKGPSKKKQKTLEKNSSIIGLTS